MRQVRDGSQQHLGAPPARTDAAAPTSGPFAIAQGDIRGTTAGHSRSGAESAEGCGRRVGGWHVPIIVHAFAYVKDQVGTPNPPPEFEEPRNRRLPGRWGCTSLGMDSRERGNDGGGGSRRCGLSRVASNKSVTEGHTLPQKSCYRRSYVSEPHAWCSAVFKRSSTARSIRRFSLTGLSSSYCLCMAVLCSDVRTSYSSRR